VSLCHCFGVVDEDVGGFVKSVFVLFAVACLVCISQCGEFVAN
jgi:hypothetical protein